MQKQISRVHIEAPRTARILGGQNPKRKTPFPFSRKNFTPAKSEMQRVLFLSGLLAYSPVHGAFSESFVLKIGSSLVQ
jgi:hypothetical protein